MSKPWIRACMISVFIFGSALSLLASGCLQAQDDPLDRPFREPLYLIHITKTNTMYGPVEKDVYILHPVQPNKDGVVMTADGYGGWFINEGSLAGGPFRTPREVCNAVKGMDKKKLSLRFVCPETKAEPSRDEEKQKEREMGEEKEEQEDREREQLKDQDKERDKKKDEEKKKDECDQERLDEEIREINKIQDHVIYADGKFQEIKAQLGLMRIAAAKKRAKIRSLESAAKEGDYSEEMKQKLEKRVEELQDEVFEILKEQDSELKNALYNYDDALGEIKKWQQDSKCKDVRTVLAKLQEKYKKKREMVELELLMASCDPNQRDKFHALARRYIDENKHKDFVHLMQALDYVERKDPRSALYALRKALKENPDNTVVQNLLKNIELGYLKGIDEKITGEAASVRARLWEHLSQHGEEGFLGTLYDILTTGVTASASAIGGKPQSLADLAATIGDEAQVQHSGLILIIRMREAGISLKDIRDMVIKDKTSGKNPMDFTQVVKDKFGWNLTKEQALKMRFTINMAFKNPDVNRLSAESKQVFDIDRGKSYFNSDAFDATWQDWIGDVVNVKNVAVMLGPSAVISSGGKLAIHGSKLVEETMTVRDAFCNLIKLPQLADKLAKTKAGQAAIAELFKFEKNTGLVSKVVAEALIQQGLIKAGEMIGGKAGAVAAEIITVLGVGDIDQTLRILKQNGVTPETLANLGKALRQAAKSADQVGTSTQKYVRQLDDALQETAEKGAVSPSTRSALKQSQDDIDDQLQRMMRQAQGGDVPLSQRQQMEMMQKYKEAIGDAMSGNQAGAKVAKKTVENLEEQSRNTVTQLTKQADTCDDLASGLRKAETDVNLNPAKEMDTDGVLGRKPKSDPLEELTHNDGLEGPADPKKALTMKRVRQEADRVQDIRYTHKTMDGKQKPGSMLGLEGADDAMLKKNYDQAENLYKKKYIEVLDDPDYTAAERQVILKKAQQAKAAKEATERFQGVDSQINNSVAKNFEPDELDEIAVKLKSGEYVLERIEKPTAAKPYWIKNAETGEKLFIVKPHDSRIPNNWDVKGEILRHRIAQNLDNVNVKTPAAAKVNLEIDDNPTNCAIVRYVRGSDLEANPLGVQYTVKQQVAEDKAISTLMLSHDRHSGNILVDEAGDAFAIDHGYNGIGVAVDEPVANADTYIRDYMGNKCMSEPKKDLIIRNLENQIIYDDMDNVVNQLERMQNWTDDQFRSLLDGLVDSDDEMQKVIYTLRTSSQNLRQTLQDNFPTINDNLLRSSIPVKTPLSVSLLTPFQFIRQRWTVLTLHAAFQGGLL